MLKGGTQKGNSFEYKYDAENLRYEKTVNGVTTRYYYNAGQLQAEERGDEFIYYLYGIEGITGMVYDGQYYIYEKNILGDVIGIYDSNRVKVATYDYDAWGNVVRKSGTMADVNPIRYRGYYYDTETGFYYLNTRYYDPEIRRFVNADNYELLPELAGVYGQVNLYNYCNNNPVMYTDPTGELSILLSCLIAFGIGAAVGFGSSAISQGLTYGWDNISWGQAIFDGAMGGVTGVLSVFGLGAGVQAGIGAITGLASYVVDCGVHGQDPTLLGALLATGVGAIANASAGYLIEYGGFKHAFRQTSKRIVDLSAGKFAVRVTKGLWIPTAYQIANIGYNKLKDDGTQSGKAPYWW